jgi:hypothetical protein
MSTLPTLGLTVSYAENFWIEALGVLMSKSSHAAVRAQAQEINQHQAR